VLGNPAQDALKPSLGARSARATAFREHFFASGEAALAPSPALPARYGPVLDHPTPLL